MHPTAEQLAELSDLIGRFGSTDNAERSAAEAHFHKAWQTERASLLVLGLAALMRAPSSAMERSCAAVLLRRTCLKPMPGTDAPLWTAAIPADVRIAARAELLAAVATEADRSARRKAVDAVAEAARLDAAPWPELRAFVSAAVGADDASAQEAAWLVVAAVPSLMLAADDPAAMHALVTTAVCALASSDALVRLACLRAVCAVIVLPADVMPASTRNALCQALVPPLAACVMSFLPPPSPNNMRSEDDAVAAIEAFAELIEQHPKSLVRAGPDTIRNIVAFAARIMREEVGMVEDQTLSLVIELVLTAAESVPAYCRKHVPHLATDLVPPLLHLLARVCDEEEEEAWFTSLPSATSSNDYESDIHIMASQALDRLARALGPQIILPPLFQHLPAFLSSTEWTQRFAGLICISAIAEGCVKLLQAELPSILQMIANGIRDPHGRVRYGGLQALGQVCTDFGHLVVRKEFMELLIGSLCFGMEDPKFPRVQAHGAAALINVSEQAPKELMSPFLSLIVPRLTNLLNSPHLFLQEQAITSLATVADSCGDSFRPYAASLLPALLGVMTQHLNAGDESSYEWATIVGKLMECISLIGLAVGPNDFKSVAETFVNSLSAIQSKLDRSDDTKGKELLLSYLQATWARVAKLIGPEQFSPFLPSIMPSLIASARAKPDYSIVDIEDAPPENEEDDDWEYVKIDNQKIGIKTSILEEKCTAIELLICYARDMGAAFHAYALEILELCIQLLRFYFHDGVRTASALCIPHLLKSMMLANYPHDKIKDAWYNAISALLSACHNEEDNEVVVEFLVAIYEIFETMGAGSLGDDALMRTPVMDANGVLQKDLHIMAFFGQMISGQIAELFGRIRKRQEQREDGDAYDEEMEIHLQDEEESDDQILTELSRAVHIIFRTQGAKYLPHFNNTLFPTVSGMLHSLDGKSPESAQLAALQARQFAICAFDDLIEFAADGKVLLEYKGQFWQTLYEGLLNVAAPDFRQACCYGIGLLAVKVRQNVPNDPSINVVEAWFPSIKESLDVLLHSLNVEALKQPEHVLANENTVSAIAKILYTYGPSLAQHHIAPLIADPDFSRIVSVWLNNLPICEDEEESVYVYGYLLSLLSAHHPALTHDLSRVLNILVKCVGCGILGNATSSSSHFGTGAEVERRVVDAVRVLMSSMDDQKKALAWNQLNDEERERVASKLQ